jgi:hypothetical protein
MIRRVSKKFAPKGRWQTFACYAVAALLSVLIVTWALKLWKADLNVPFYYLGDAIFHGMVIKGTLENGWYLNNGSVGMPGGLKMHDFPMPDALNFLLIKLLGLIRPHYAWVLNVFFLLTFPLTAMTSLYVFRQFKLSCPSAVVWSLLYATLPYHFLRGESHLFVTTYYLVPLIVLVALWICSGELCPFDKGKQGRSRFWRHRKFVLALVFCALASSVGFGYYAFFSCFFLLIAGVIGAVCHRRLVHLATAAILIGIIVLGMIANLTPNIIYRYRNAPNNVAERAPQSAEVYGLKIAQLLLPIRGHRVGFLSNLKKEYDYGPLINENSAAALGFIGGAGFLILLWWLFFKKPGSNEMKSNGMHSILNYLSLLNMAAVLLATIGGFSSLFALLIWAQIRSYNRISIYIAFFCLLAVALLLEDFFRKHIRSGAPQIAMYALLAVVLVLGVLDQTSKEWVPDYSSLQSNFNSDKNFVAEIEASLPTGAMIFQLPYVSFPESAPVVKMSDYELFRGYLHSRSLTWSYGAMKGRESDQWQREVALRPTDEQLDIVTFAGFSGVYIDRYGFADDGRAIEAKLVELLGEQPVTSSNQRLSFFDLRNYSEKLKGKYSPEEWQGKSEDARHPILLEWSGGFSGLEQTAERNWRWCSSEGQLVINNATPRERKIVLEMVLASGSDANMQIKGPYFSESFKINSNGVPFSKTITIPLGIHRITFQCDGQRIEAPWDHRYLVFKIENFKWRETD